MRNLLILIVILFNSLVVFSQDTWTEQKSNYTGWLKQIHFTNAQVGFAVGANGSIVSTSDGGLNWTVKYLTGFQNLYGVHFTSPTTGFVISEGVNDTAYIYKTTDGGNMWYKKAYAPGSWFYKVRFFSPGNGFVIGASPYGAIIGRTSDAGETWTNVINKTVTPLGIYMLNDYQTGWFVGANGVIFKTIDGGSNWSGQISPTLNSLEEVQFISSTIGYAVGRGGVVVKTTNGGSDWVDLNTGITDNLFALYFKDANNGWIVGGDTTSRAKVYKTTNGGGEWKLQLKADSSDFFLSISFTKDNATGWISGDYGKIYKYTSTPTHTITTTSISKTQYCMGNTITVPFMVSGKFNTDNIFTLQLSDEKGSFDKPINLDTLAQANAGTITSIIPDSIKESTTASYKVRIVSSSPRIFGASSGGIKISSNPKAFKVTGGGIACEESNGVLIGLENSQKNMNYQLVVNGTNFGAPIPGEDDAIYFTPVHTSGTYFIIASNLGNSACSKLMIDSANVLIKPRPEKPTISRENKALVSSEPLGNQWYLNGNKLIDSVNQKIFPSEVGKYTVEITKNDCISKKSDPYDFDPAGISFGELGNLTILVNENILELNTNNEELLNKLRNLDYTVYNCLGEEIVIKETTFELNSIKLNFQNLNNGVYFIKIANTFEKFIIWKK